MTLETEAETLWFNATRVEIAVPQQSNADRISILSMTLPFDDAPPLHVHGAEDEIFHILDGEIRFEVGGEPQVKRAGDTLLAPRGVPHGFRVVSRGGARMLVVTRGGFEAMVRAVSHAAGAGAPADRGPPSPEAQAELIRHCALHGIEIVGPPIA